MILDGKVGVVSGVMLRPEVRIDLWTKDAERVVANFAEQLPIGVGLAENMKQQDYVHERMANLTNNLWISIVAVALTIFFYRVAKLGASYCHLAYRFFDGVGGDASVKHPHTPDVGHWIDPCDGVVD